MSYQPPGEKYVETIGFVIRLYRLMGGMSEERLGDLLGGDYQLVRAIEENTIPLDVPRLILLQQTLKIPNEEMPANENVEWPKLNFVLQALDLQYQSPGDRQGRVPVMADSEKPGPAHDL